MRLALERRPSVPRWALVAVPAGSVLAALAVAGILLRATGHQPLTVYAAMGRASYGSWFGLTDTLATATPLILTGLAAALAFSVRLYNIGAEGQLYVGAICSSGAALLLGPRMPRPAAILVVLLAGVAGGALWMVVPALGRAWLGANEIITTLLLNYVALYWMRFLIFGSHSVWRDPGATNFPQGLRIPPAYLLPHLDTTRVHFGLGVALLAAVGLYWVLRSTRWGYDLRVLHDSDSAARYAGIRVRRVIMVVLLVSGAVAGLAGASEVAGRAGRLDPSGLSIGLGYAGIIVAVLARLNPIGVVVVAVLFGGLENAGTTVQTLGGARLPVAISTMLQGAILLFALSGEVLTRYRPRLFDSRPAPPAAGLGEPAAWRRTPASDEHPR